MADKPTRPVGDDLGQFLTWLLAGIACALLAVLHTGPALIGLLSVALLAWLVGREERQLPLVVIAVASILIVFTMVASGQGLPIVLNWFYSYALSFNRSGWDGAYDAWLATFSWSKGWVLGLSIGASTAAGAILVRDARRNSLSAQLLESKFPQRRREAPLVRLRRRWIAFRPEVEGSITLGTNILTGARVVILFADLFRHLLIVGTTGSGKTNTVRIVIAACLKYGFSVLFLDGKGDDELANENCALAEKLGVPVYHFDANHPDNSCAYNPIAAGDATSRASRIMAIGEHAHPHFEKIDLEFVQTACAVLEAAGIPVDLIQIGQYLDTKSLIGALRRKDLRDRQHAQSLATRITQLRANEKDISGLRADIRIITHSSLAKLFDTRDKTRKVLELAKARAEGAYIHAKLPGLKYPDLTKRLGRLWVEDVKATADLSDRPLLVFFDEAHAYAGENLIPLVSMGRSYKIALAISVTSYSQLQNLSSKGPHASFADSLITSTNLQIVHQVISPADAQLAADLGGTIEDLEITSQTEGEVPSSMGSLRAVRSYRHHPDALKRLTRGEAVFMNKIAGTISRLYVRKAE